MILERGVLLRHYIWLMVEMVVFHRHLICLESPDLEKDHILHFLSKDGLITDYVTWFHKERGQPKHIYVMSQVVPILCHPKN